MGGAEIRRSNGGIGVEGWREYICSMSGVALLSAAGRAHSYALDHVTNQHAWIIQERNHLNLERHFHITYAPQFWHIAMRSSATLVWKYSVTSSTSFVNSNRNHSSNNHNGLKASWPTDISSNDFTSFPRLFCLQVSAGAATYLGGNLHANMKSWAILARKILARKPSVPYLLTHEVVFAWTGC